MSSQCKISRVFDLSFTPDRCFDLSFTPERCFDLCMPGSDISIDPATCDIRFVDYQTQVSCALAIDSVALAGNVATITASSGTGTIYYRFLASDGETVLQDWSTDNSYDTGGAGTYFAQATDTFGCVATDEFEVV